MTGPDDLRLLLRRILRLPANDLPGGISCHEAAARLNEWLDGELEPELASPVTTHLETCARCYPFLVFERSFREAVTRAPQITGTPEAVRDRILKALETEGFGSS